MEKDKQNKKILMYLRAKGSITPMEALENGINCMRLSARIFDLKKQGIPIATKMEHRGNKRFARYFLVNNDVPTNGEDRKEE